VGIYVNGIINQTLVKHWDGTSWSVVAKPMWARAITSLNGVAVLTNDIVGYGLYSTAINQTLVEHWVAHRGRW